MDEKVKEATIRHFDIDKILGGAKDRIYRVGVELEGGWDKQPAFKHGEKIIRDGSVTIKLKRDQVARVEPIFDLATEITYHNRHHGTRDVTNQGGNVVGTNVDPLNLPVLLDRHGRIMGAGMQHDYMDHFRRNFATRIRQEENLDFAPNYVGEVPSPVLERSAVADWLRTCYPPHVNDTCGLHVHMSFPKALHYQRLMVPEYQATILTYLSKWAMNEGMEKEHPIWDRLSGKNRFCNNQFFADAQAKKTSKSYDHEGQGNRYTAINYCHGQHGSLECRVLPMFKDVEIAIKAVDQVIDITNACLKFQARKEKGLTALVIESALSNTKEKRVEYV